MFVEFPVPKCEGPGAPDLVYPDDAGEAGPSTPLKYAALRMTTLNFSMTRALSFAAGADGGG
jgi:hypothetical protein